MIGPHDFGERSFRHLNVPNDQICLIIFAKRIEHYGREQPVEQEHDQKYECDQWNRKQQWHVGQRFLRFGEQF